MAIGEWKKKAWGQTRALHLDRELEVIECEILAGGFSSHHLHAKKSNEFLVISGRLLLFIDDCLGGRVRELTPASGIYCIPAGIKHGFQAAENVVLVEFYRASGAEPVDPEDIERFTSGGLRK